MAKWIAICAGACAAVAWWLYVRSLPPRVGLGSLLRDTSTLAIGLGAYRFGAYVMAREPAGSDVPVARVVP
jgi:hypothetical protein